MLAVKKTFQKYILGMQPGMFRLFLASLVVLYHAFKSFPFGMFAVYTFFILSGYWVSKMYNEFYSQKRNGLLLFLYSRVLRLFPLYLLCTAIMLLVQKFYIEPYHHEYLLNNIGLKEYSYLLLMLPLNALDFQLLVPAWSLAVEMQFYILAPLLLWAMRKTNTALLFAIALIVSVCAICATGFRYNNLQAYICYFIIGMFIYRNALQFSAKTIKATILIIGCIIAACYALPILRNNVLNEEAHYGAFYYCQLLNHLLPFLFVPFITHNLRQKSTKADRVYGDFSYTIYLVHWSVIAVYNRLYAFSGFSLFRLGYIAAALALIVLLSLAVYWWFEKPVEAFRKKVVARMSEAEPQSKIKIATA